MFTDSYEYYINDIKLNNSLSYEEEKDLKNRILNGDEKAKVELYERHLKFVISIAKRYQNSFLELSDLINEGNYGMMVAIEKFQYEKDVRFMTYAIYWIRHYINNALTNDSRTIRIPSNIVNGEDFETTEKTIPNCISLTPLFNVDINENEDNTIVSDTEIIEKLEIDDNLDNNNNKEIIFNLMSALNEREKEIIGMYYGLDGVGERNLSEIGEIVGLTKERVRQIKVSALRKLKSNVVSLDNSLFE